MSDTLIQIKPSEARPDPDQPRKDFDPEAVKALAGSLKAVGLIQPITVRQNGKGYIIIAGERRWRAAKEARLQTIPAILRSETDDQLALATVENVARLDLNPVEEGDAYRKLVEAHGKVEAVAKLAGRPVERVNDRIGIAGLPERARNQVISGKLNLPQARVLVAANADHPPLAEFYSWAIDAGRIDPDDLRQPWQALFTAARDSRGSGTKACDACGGAGYDEDTDLDCDACDGTGRVAVEATDNPDPMPDVFLMPMGNYGTFPINAAALTDHARERLDASQQEAQEHEAALRAKAKGGYYYGQSAPYPQFNDDEHADAALAAGCAIKIGHHTLLVDPAWASEYLPDVYAEQVAEFIKGGKRGSSSSEPATADEADKAARKAEREKERKAAERARAHNVALGAALTAWQPTAKADVLDAVKYLATTLLARTAPDSRETTLNALETLARFTEDGLPVVKYKDGRWKGVTYDRSGQTAAEREKATLAAIDKAKTVEEVLAAALRPIIAAMAVKTEGLPQADKRGGFVPHTFHSGPAADRVGRLMGKVKVKA